VLDAFVRNAVNSTDLSHFQWFYELLYISGSYFSQTVVPCNFKQCLDSSLHPPFMVFVTQVMRCELKSAVLVAFSRGWYVKPKRPWIALGVFGPSLFMRDFIVGHMAWDVTSHFPILFSHHSSAILLVIFLMFFWLNWLPFYMLDPRFLTTIFVVSACILTKDLIQEYRSYLCLKT
jgi:hypothetical protein